MTRRLTPTEIVKNYLLRAYKRRLRELGSKDSELRQLITELTKSFKTENGTPQYYELEERFKDIILRDPEMKEIFEIKWGLKQ